MLIIVAFVSLVILLWCLIMEDVKVIPVVRVTSHYRIVLQEDAKLLPSCGEDVKLLLAIGKASGIKNLPHSQHVYNLLWTYLAKLAYPRIRKIMAIKRQCVCELSGALSRFLSFRISF